MPSAKMMAWTEAMYHFFAAPEDYGKMFFVLKDVSTKRHETPAKYYLRRYEHMIPNDVEYWEYDAAMNSAERIRLQRTPLSEGMQRPQRPSGAGRKDGSAGETPVLPIGLVRAEVKTRQTGV